MSFGSYDYDRRKASAPANQFKNVEQNLRQVDHQFEVTRGTLHGLLADLGLIAKHTTNRHLRDTYDQVSALTKRIDAIDEALDKVLRDMGRVEHQFGNVALDNVL